jgi:hypothetical protein
MTQAVECLLSKCQALSSNPNTTKNMILLGYWRQDWNGEQIES